MIDDTLLNCLGTFEMQKLLTYEQNIFNKLLTNVKTISSSLYKQDHHVPSEEERKNLLKLRNQEQFKAVTSNL